MDQKPDDWKSGTTAGGRLKDLFFFPAETFGTASVIKDAARQSQVTSMKVDEAIRTLLAGDVYDNAIDDLRKAIDSKALRSAKAKVSDSAIEAAERDFTDAQAHLADAERLSDELPMQLAAAVADAERATLAAQQYDA